MLKRPHKLNANVLLTGAWLCIIIVLAGLMPSPASAQANRISNAQANAFFEECLEKPLALKTFENIGVFCACSAARLKEQLRTHHLEDLKFPESRAARKVYEQILTYIYIPCMREPLIELLHEECMTSEVLDEFPQINREGYCHCEQWRQKALFKDASHRIYRQEMDEENTMEVYKAPIASYLTHEYYQEKSAEVTNLCMKKNLVRIEGSRRTNPKNAFIEEYIKLKNGN